MRKKVFGKKLGKNRRGRGNLFRAQAKSLVLHGHIKTTRAKAQALRPEVEKLITLVKKGDLVARRAALARLGNDRKITAMLFESYKALANSRNSGFTKMVRLNPRRGDSAEMVSLSWVEMPEEEKKKNENVPNKN